MEKKRKEKRGGGRGKEIKSVSGSEVVGSRQKPNCFESAKARGWRDGG